MAEKTPFSLEKAIREGDPTAIASTVTAYVHQTQEARLAILEERLGQKIEKEIGRSQLQMLVWIGGMIAIASGAIIGLLSLLLSGG